MGSAALVGLSLAFDFFLAGIGRRERGDLDFSRFTKEGFTAGFRLGRSIRSGSIARMGITIMRSPSRLNCTGDMASIRAISPSPNAAAFRR